MDEAFENHEETVKSEMIYEGRILNLRVDTVELPNRMYSKREIVEHQRSVGMLCFEGDELFLIKQYRKATEQVMLELPAGMIEAGEQPREAALREMEEEIGYSTEDLEYLCDSYSSPGFTDERISFFAATDLFERKRKSDDDEFLEVVKIPFNEVLEMIELGEILDGKTILACLYYDRMLRNE